MLALHFFFFFFFKVSASWKLLTQNGKHGVLASLWWWMPSALFFPSLSVVAFFQPLSFVLWFKSLQSKASWSWLVLKDGRCTQSTHIGLLATLSRKQKQKQKMQEEAPSGSWETKPLRYHQSQQLQRACSWRRLSIRHPIIYVLFYALLVPPSILVSMQATQNIESEVYIVVLFKPLLDKY